MIADLPPEPPPALVEEAEPQYPFGGFLFSGSADALKRLKRYGEERGLVFRDYKMPSGEHSLLLAGDVAFGKMDAVTDLVNKSQRGTFGDVRLGLISEPPRP